MSSIAQRGISGVRGAFPDFRRNPLRMITFLKCVSLAMQGVWPVCLRTLIDAGGKDFNMRRNLFILGVVILSIFPGTRAISQSPSTGAQLAVVGGTIYPSPTEAPIRDGVVLINDGKIVAVGRRGAVQVPRGVTVIEATGSTITAGFWNSHTHFLERMWNDAATLPAGDLSRSFQLMLTRYGFTSVFDIWSSLENTRRLRDRVESGEVVGPRIRFTGPAMFSRGAAESPEMELSAGDLGLSGVHADGENPIAARGGGVRCGRPGEETT